MMSPDSFHCVGLDLAWGMTARTGVAVVGDDGQLVGSSSVLHDQEIKDSLRPYAATIRTAAIDAPLVVTNESGQRPCERQISSAFGRYEASAHSSNLGRKHFVAPRGARLADDFGWDMDPVVRPSSGRPTCIEVYPHPAMVSLFGLDQTIKYKGGRGRTVIYRQSAFDLLMGHMATHLTTLRLSDNPRWLALRGIATHATRPIELERIEDEIDAIFCAHLAWLWVTAPEQLTVFGDIENGYIVTPPAPGF
jgi:predicted RNase H-like nuclease